MRHSLRVALAIAVISCTALFGQSSRGMVSYPEEWGENLALEENGGSVYEVSSTGGGDEYALIDGRSGEDYHWEPLWSAGRPWYFIIELAEESPVSIIRLDTTSDLDGGGVPRKTEVRVGNNPSKLDAVWTGDLPNESVQVIFLEKPARGRFVMIKVLSDYGEEGGEVGEIGIFSGRGGVASAGGAFRGSDAADALRTRSGDLLSGALQNAQFECFTPYGKMTFPRAAIACVLFRDEKFPLDRIFLLNGDVFHGFVLDKTISIKLANGTRLDMPRETVGGIGTRVLATEAQPNPAKDRLFLRGGMSVSGKLSSRPLTLVTPYAQIVLLGKDVASIEFGGTGKPLLKAVMKNGDVYNGSLLDDWIAFTLDSGIEIAVHASDCLAFQAGK